MTIKRVTPAEAQQLLQEGWSYLDVRSELEFAEGHPTGAYNLPIMHMNEAGQRQANGDFDTVAQACFATDQKLVLGCATVRRSSAAADRLSELGFENLVVMSGGWNGEQDSLGRTTVEGWSTTDYPSSTAPQSGHSYGELATKGRAS